MYQNNEVLNEILNNNPNIKKVEALDEISIETRLESSISELIRYYTHMIKYRLLKEVQSTSWLNSIKGATNDYFYYAKKNKVEKYLNKINKEDLYYKGLEVARKETKDNNPRLINNLYDKNNLILTYNEIYLNWEMFINVNLLLEYLYDHRNKQKSDIKKYLDIWSDQVGYEG